jgi:hypothetical protein
MSTRKPLPFVVGMALAAGVLSAGAAEAKVKRSCAVRGTRILTIDTTGRLALHVGSEPGADNVLYGCLNRTRRPRTLAVLSFVSAFAEDVRTPRLAAPLAAFNRFGGGPAARCYSRIEVWNLQTGTRQRRVTAQTDAGGDDVCGVVDGLVLSRTGTAAWIAHDPKSGATEVRKLGGGGAVTLDTGNIDRGSLALSGDGVIAYWTRDRIPHSSPMN